jgi:hypothetical protein
MPSLAPRAASNSLYLKFNSSVLADPKFLPTFRDMWLPLAAARLLSPARDPPQPDPNQTFPVLDVLIPVPVAVPAPPVPASVTPPLLLACPWTLGPPPCPGSTRTRSGPQPNLNFHDPDLPVPPHPPGPYACGLAQCSFWTSPLHTSLLIPAPGPPPPWVAQPLKPLAPVFIPGQPAPPPPPSLSQTSLPWTCAPGGLRLVGTGGQAGHHHLLLALRSQRCLSPISPLPPSQPCPGAGPRLGCCGGCTGQLPPLDAAVAAILAISTHTPLAEQEASVRDGGCSGLQSPWP